MKATSIVSQNMFKFFLAVIVILFYIFWIYHYYSPLLQADVNTLDNRIAFYIDSLSTVEEGSVAIPIDARNVAEVAISYETEGEYDGYDIPEDGWYAVVTYSAFGRPSSKSSSMINAYLPTTSMYETFTAPRGICITKVGPSEYPEVEECQKLSWRTSES
jgi:hypothetical protein